MNIMNPPDPRGWKPIRPDNTRPGYPKPWNNRKEGAACGCRECIRYFLDWYKEP